MFYSSTFHLLPTSFMPEIFATGWNFLNLVRYLISSAMLGGEHRDVSGKATRGPLESNIFIYMYSIYINISLTKAECL